MLLLEVFLAALLLLSRFDSPTSFFRFAKSNSESSEKKGSLMRHDIQLENGAVPRLACMHYVNQITYQGIKQQRSRVIFIAL